MAQGQNLITNEPLPQNNPDETMKKGNLRWNVATNRKEVNPLVDAFLEDLLFLCKKHGLSLSHEDGHGAFLVENYEESNSLHLEKAFINIDPHA